MSRAMYGTERPPGTRLEIASGRSVVAPEVFQLDFITKRAPGFKAEVFCAIVFRTSAAHLGTAFGSTEASDLVILAERQARAPRVPLLQASQNPC